jgi:hypothetical protein
MEINIDIYRYKFEKKMSIWLIKESILEAILDDDVYFNELQRVVLQNPFFVFIFIKHTDPVLNRHE